MDYMIEHNIPHLQQEAGISRSPAVLNFIDYFILTQRDGGIKRKMCDFHIKIHVLVSVTVHTPPKSSVLRTITRFAMHRNGKNAVDCGEKLIFQRVAPCNSGFSWKLRTKTPRGTQP
ncbi:hypothetical protein, partial [[Clostridium] symbiosum]